jgi:hypothetical protein
MRLALLGSSTRDLVTVPVLCVQRGLQYGDAGCSHMLKTDSSVLAMLT